MSREIMTISPRAKEFGDQLERFKLASGRSYESIGKKAHLSKSAVHRYCTGATVPREFAVVERIALTCGANRTEMAQLHHLWLRAAAESDTPEGKIQPAEPPPSPAPPSTVRSTRPKRPLALAAVTTVMAALLVSSSASTHSAGNPATASDQWVVGPAWALPPTPVPRTLFGVTINSATGAMPAFRVGAARFWDGGTRWSEIQRRRGEFDWTTLDRLVKGAEAAGIPPLFVFGGTPKWANPSGPATPYADSVSAPPTDLADWDVFVQSLVNRYRGRIEAYELWVLANDRRFYSGSAETLAEMTRRAREIIRTTDPKATVLCPGMGELWSPNGISFLKSFIEAGGYDHCDVASIKLFQRRPSDPPETMLDIVTSIDRIMHEAGIHPRLWSTGTTYSIAMQDRLDDATAKNHAVRFFLTGIYARKANLERMYFYNWGGVKIPIVLQPIGGVPTSAALAVERLQHWLENASVRSCGHGTTANLPENVWQCEFTVVDPDQSYDATIRWTDKGTATTPVGPGVQELRRLDGEVEALRPGGTVTVGEEPVLLATSRATLR
ncbi:helix-turn-helix domain-containing protein [Lentzea cavernae]|nr:helix-turn-helix domain-containing protein [Lentzea cavernae]